MGTKTGIEWTDSTWNPIRGCSRVSEGCRNCYAEMTAGRFSGPGHPYEGLVTRIGGEARWTGRVDLVEKHLLDPLKWGPFVEHRRPGPLDYGCENSRKCDCPARPRRIFVNSMSDLFHGAVTDEIRNRIFAVMALCPEHTFQVLTKRPERMRDYILRCEESGMAWRRHRVVMAMQSFDRGFGFHDPQWPLPNVWLGVSVENQPAADERIPLLLQTPASVRFVSCEPLLGPVNIAAYLGFQHEDQVGITNHDQSRPEVKSFGFHDPWVRGIDWVIAGGESGPGARPMHPNWARSLRDQCAAAGVPFFFKQWGEWGPCENGEVTPNPQDWDDPAPSHEFQNSDRPRCAQEIVYRVGKKSTGCLLDGREWKQFPVARP
jgi:protein gp37